MKENRDTQFRGFAKALLNELGDQGFVFEGADDADREQQLECIEQLIARRAYDLACHVIDNVSESQAACREVNFITSEEVVSDIPDLIIVPDLITELPKEQEL